MVALVLIVFAAFRVITRERSTVEEALPQQPARSPLRRPHYEPKRPRHFALPPDTIETLPIDFKRVGEMVPPIDPRVLAALVASGSRAAAEVPRPQELARGSIAQSFAAASDSEVDDAETLRPASDLDDDALTRTNMSRVR